jgi:hypothetical protein
MTVRIWIGHARTVATIQLRPSQRTSELDPHVWVTLKQASFSKQQRAANIRLSAV